MKKSFILLIILFLISLTSCGNSNRTLTPTTVEPSTTITAPSDDNQTTTKEEDETANKTLILKIDNEEVDVTWLDNSSVKALKELAKDGLTINMSKYGGFEQVGSIGSTLPSVDTRITTNPGDIVL